MRTMNCAAAVMRVSVDAQSETRQRTAAHDSVQPPDMMHCNPCSILLARCVCRVSFAFRTAPHNTKRRAEQSVTSPVWTPKCYEPIDAF